MSTFLIYVIAGLVLLTVFGLFYGIYLLISERSRDMRWFDWLLIGPIWWVILLVLWLVSKVRRS